MLTRCAPLLRSLSPALGAALAVLFAAAPASAAEDRTIDAALSAGGALTFRTLTITSKGALSALPYVAGSTTSTGVLDITADTIIVEAGGVISADGAGYQSVALDAGACAPMPASCPPAGASAGLPGGGGGFFAAGGNGTSESMAGVCVDLANGAVGGPAYYTMGAMVLGSPGGSANLGSLSGGQGGAGGGYIRLSAAVIQIDGAVHANGASPQSPHYGGVGPGGGSGGVIEITAALLRGGGSLAVDGGAGAHGTGLLPSGAPNDGGGGAGGVILVHLPAEASMPLATSESGGATGDCTAPTTAAGAGTLLSASMATGCVDLDMDGYTSIQCGGDDCDDTDPTIHPGAGTCATADAGPMTDAGADHRNPDEYVQYGGGCSVEVPAPGAYPRLVGGCAALAVVVGAARSRRRRARLGARS